MDWRVLRENKLADEAEKLGGFSYGGTGDFGEAPAPAPFRPMSFSESDSPFTSPQTQFQSTPSEPDPMAGTDRSVLEGAKKAAKVGEFGLHTLGDAFDTSMAVPLTGGYMAGRTIGKVYGNEMPGSYSEDLQKGASDLFSLPYRLGQTLEGKTTERDGLMKQTISHAIESGAGAFNPDATTGERMRMGVGALAGGITALTQPGGIGKVPYWYSGGKFHEVNPVFDLAQGIAKPFERFGAAAADATMGKGLLASRPGLLNARRGATDIPKEVMDRINRLSMKAATKIDKWGEPAVDQTKIGMYWEAAADRAGEVAKMDDAAVLSLMKDAGKVEARAEARTGVPLNRADMVADPMRTPMAESELGLSPEATREILGEPDLATGAARAYAPRGESAADRTERLTRVEQSIAEGGDIEQLRKDASLLDRSSAQELAKSMGAKGRLNKDEAIDFVMAQAEAKAKLPTQPPTTPLGRQEAKELELAAQAEKVAEASPVDKLSSGTEDTFLKVQDHLLEGNGIAANAALRDSGLSMRDYSAWRKVREGAASPTTAQQPQPPLAGLQQPSPSPEATALGSKELRIGTGPQTQQGRQGTPETPSAAPSLETPSMPSRGSGQPQGAVQRPQQSPAQAAPLQTDVPASQPPQPIGTTAGGERQKTGFSMNLVDELQNTSVRSGNAAGQKLAEDLRETINYAESRAARPIAEWNDGVRAAARNPAAREEVSELVNPSAFRDAGVDNWRIGRFQGNIDDNAAVLGVRPEEVAFQTPEAKALAENYLRRMAETGYEAKALGVTKADGTPFEPMIRRFTQQPDPSAKNWMVKGNPEFEDFLQEARAIYPDAEPKALRDSLQSWANQSIDRPAAFEFERLYPMMPAARVSKRTGEMMPILNHNVLPTALNTEGSVSQLFRSQWTRLGGIKHIGQDVTMAMADGPLDAAGALSQLPLGEALAADASGRVSSAARGALGALYNRPQAGLIPYNTSETALVKSRSGFMQSLRGVMRRVIPAANLSLQGPKSMAQTFGEVPAMTGAVNFSKALAKGALKYGESSEEARLAGALHEKMLAEGSKVWDQHRIIESVMAAGANKLPTERINDFVKDLNDTIAYTAGKFKAEEMLGKGAKQTDFLMMDEMNLPRSVQDVFRNPSAYDDAARTGATRDFARRITQETQFHSKNKALRGRIENDHYLGFIWPYRSYSINTMKRSVKDIERILSASGQGVDKNSNMLSRFLQRMNPFGDDKAQFRNAVQRFATRGIGMGVAGEVTADISSAMQGKDPLRRDRSATARLLENLSYASFLGPFQFAADMIAVRALGGNAMFGDSSETKKRFAEARVGGREPNLSNPLLETATDASVKLLKGDVGGAAWEVTGGMAPIVPGVLRATGLMSPSGERDRAPQDNSSGGRRDMLGGGVGKRKDRLGGGQSSKVDRLGGGTVKRKNRLD